MSDKFPEELRTFETRLEFLRDIFSALYPPEDILSGCIQHKLDRAFMNYVESLNACMLNLSKEDPLKVLKNIK